MKKFIYLTMFCLFFYLWGCSDSSNGVDPIENFREFSVDLRDLIKDETIKAGLELAALPDDDPNEGAYIKITEDILLQYMYCQFIISKVINLDIVSRSGNVFSNEDRDVTVTVSNDGVYRMDGEFYVDVDGAWELLNVTYTWTPATNRWLITGSRLELPSGDDEPVPFLRQEGEWNDNDQVYSATTLYFVEDGIRRVGNALFTYGDAEDTFQMASEREAGCESTCVDINSTDLYDQGIVAMDLTEWDDFKTYFVEDENPDYEMPAPLIEVK